MSIARKLMMSGGGGSFPPPEPDDISPSVVMDGNFDTYFSRAMVATGNRQVYTLGGWVKRTLVNTSPNLGYTDAILYRAGIGTDSNDHTYLAFTSDSGLTFVNRTSGASNMVYSSIPLLDPFEFYHVHVTVNTTDVAGQRIKFWVNGQRVAATISTEAPLGGNTFFGTAGNTLFIGSQTPTPSNELCGILNDSYYFDGVEADVNDFGFFDTNTSQWVPTEYAGADPYGTNGHLLQFGNALDLGEDTSGNGNNYFTSAGVKTTLDRPLCNYASFAKEDSYLCYVGHGGLYAAYQQAVGNQPVKGNLAVNSGKWYMECEPHINVSASGNAQVGFFGFQKQFINAVNVINYLTDYNPKFGYFGLVGSPWGARSDSLTFKNSTFTGAVLGDVMMFAIDFDAGNIWLGKNGVWADSGDPENDLNPFITFTPDGEWYTPFMSPYWTNSPANFISLKADFGQNGFKYPLPAGFLELNTLNAPAPAVGNPSVFAYPIKYTGTGAEGNKVTLNFQPDMIWFKGLSVAYNHTLVNSARGTGKYFYVNSTAVEGDITSVQFDEDGFTLGVNNTINELNATYIALAFRIGTQKVINTDGAMQSNVMANPNIGMSIVEYTTTSGPNVSYGHGLGKTPKQWWNLNILAAGNNRSVGFSDKTYSLNNQLLQLNTANAAGTFAVSDPTEALAYSGWGAGNSVLAPHFAEIEGFSKLGWYRGTGSNASFQGPFVNCGFKPAIVFVKNMSANSNNWIVVNGDSNQVNPIDKYIVPNLASIENTLATAFKFYATGFKIETTSNALNTNGSFYLFMAFAESPFKRNRAFAQRIPQALGNYVPPDPPPPIVPDGPWNIVGGEITEPGDGYRYHTFTTSSTLNILARPEEGYSNVIEYCVVGAGGGGGGAPGGGAICSGGGGAGGQVLTGSFTPSLTSGSVPITVGIAGVGGYTAGAKNSRGTNGTASIFGAPFNVTAVHGAGGGGGGDQNEINSRGNTWAGGGGAESDAFGRGLADTNVTYRGSNAGGYFGTLSAAGGGAGTAGNAGSPSQGRGGSGGSGATVWGTYYGGGGGGGGYNNGGVGAGNGGNGGVGGSGSHATGYGGGGGGCNKKSTATHYGGHGSGGVVIIRYLIDPVQE